MKIQACDISKKFGSFDALRDVSLEVPTGQLTALLGPSGSGKTTLLRVIAGLETADQGEVIYGDSNVTGLSARDRNVGFVFQHYALFNHMTIFENIAFGLRVRKWKNDAVGERVHELLKLIQLENLAKHYPSQLSGGQRQRVALARSLAPQPKVLLLDEPFGALDAKVRLELRRWLRSLHDEMHMTSLFVTHDQEEAFEVADRVVVMNHGRIKQIGSPHELDIDRQAHGEASIAARVLGISRSRSLVKLSLAAIDDAKLLEVEMDYQRDRELNLMSAMKSLCIRITSVFSCRARRKSK